MSTSLPSSKQVNVRESAESAVAAMASALDASNLAGLLNVLRRRWMVVVGTMLVVCAATAALLWNITPRYGAQALVMVDTRKPQVMVGLQQQAGQPEMAGDVVSIDLKTQTEVLRSPALAAKVIDKLGLLNNPEFNTALKPTIFERLHQMLNIPSFWWPQAPAKDPDEVQRIALDGTIKNLLEHVSVSNDGKSFMLTINAESTDPKLAADIANTFADQYLTEQLDAKYQETARVNDWLNDKLAELRGKVQATDDAVQLFKQEHNITNYVDPKDAAKPGSLKNQEVSELSSQLILAESDRAQKEGLLRQLQDAVRTGRGLESAMQVIGTPVVQHLQEQEADIRRKLADLSSHYGPRYPAVIQVNAELAEIRAKINEEVNKTIQATMNDVVASRARESSLRARMTELEGGVAQQDQAEVQLRELMRQADANKTLYEAFLQKFKLTAAEQEIEQPDAHIVSGAQSPVQPSWPPKKFLLGVAALISGLMGITLAFTLERLDNSFRSSHEIEGASELPNLGLVPALSSKNDLRTMVMTKPMSAYSEAVRTVWTGLSSSRGDRPPQVVLVTSSVPGEGKSTFAISLAQAAARSGVKTLLLDCDLRRPTIGKALGVPGPYLESGGIVGLLTGQANANAVVLNHQESGVDLLLSGSHTDNPQGLLQSARMRQYLHEMRNQYDLVVIDSPPVLLASDAAILSQMADASVFLVRWEKTPRHVALNGLKALRASGGPVAGTVLAQVDLRKHAKYGFGDVGYYYKSYGQYAT
jgi:polysaccharide biosynthesis transport protein